MDALFNSAVDHVLIAIPAIVSWRIYKQILAVAARRDDAELHRAFETGRTQGYKEGFVEGVEWRARGGPFR